MSTFTSKVIENNLKINKFYPTSLLNRTRQIQTNPKNRKGIKHNTSRTKTTKLHNLICVADFSSTKEIIPEMPNTEQNQYSKYNTKTPRLSITKKAPKQKPKAARNASKKTIDLRVIFYRKPDYRRTIIMDPDGNNNFNLLPKKLLSDTNLLFKFSRPKKIHLISKESTQMTQITQVSTDFFTKQQREEIDNIKPFEDNINLINNESNVSITSFLSSGLNEIDKTVIQDDYLLHPIYTPRQLFNKNNKKVSFTQIT